MERTEEMDYWEIAAKRADHCHAPTHERLVEEKRRAARYTSSSLALWGATSSILGPSPSSTSSIATAPPPLPSDSAPFVFVSTNSTIQNALILQLLKLSRISLSDSCSSTSSDPS